MTICIKMYPTKEERQTVLVTPLAPHIRNGAPVMHNQSIPGVRVCVSCGLPLIQRPRESAHDFAERSSCDHRCSAKHAWAIGSMQGRRARKDIPLQACAMCGAEFKPKHRREQCCSQACASRKAGI